MYRATTITYFVRAMVATGIGGVPVICTESEILHFDPRAGSSCLEYMIPFIQQAGGKILNPEATVGCQYCPGNWLSAEAQNDPASAGLANFVQAYEVFDPNDRSYGFKSWDEFFTRKFRPGVRLVDPGGPSTIASPTESTPFMIQENVKCKDSFWAKDQAYALDFLLGDSDMATQFYGGTVYQAFLSADSYHNWHAPVSGRYIRPPALVEGTYYSEPLLWVLPRLRGQGRS